MELSSLYSKLSSFLFSRIFFTVILLSISYCFNQQGPLPLALGLPTTFELEAKGNRTDQQALLEFKNKITTGHQLLWNNSVHFCQWNGITCGKRHQRVTKLELCSLKLTGSISPYIGNLSFLRVLALQNNSLSGEIPAEIGGLHRLQILALNNSSLGVEIPSNISSCSHLRTFDLGFNMLVGEIPGVIGHLSNLQVLVL